ncbi:sulfite exporter TauE/SafE family protein [Dankookia sp. P2]|uniref:sulfite exporter TauE/SafE family protein n=1 Tax=Dankookia sp. P2 TaxID=3423955 RepID=UPI003D672A61
MLGLIGGGGSIVATPLLLYAVGLSPHVALGTGALAVSANAFVNFAGHARAGNVRWGVAAVFAVAGVLGALGGSTLGKMVAGERLILLFALMMIAVGIAMLRPRKGGEDGGPIALTAPVVLRVAGTGLGVGLLSGFFGIGGGFLIVPGLILATRMPMISAVGTSLLAVGVFGLATALNYAASGLVDWAVAAEFIAGGVAGGWLGMRAACRLAADRGALNRIFAGIVLAVALYILWRSALGQA